MTMTESEMKFQAEAEAYYGHRFGVADEAKIAALPDPGENADPWMELADSGGIAETLAMIDRAINEGWDDVSESLRDRLNEQPLSVDLVGGDIRSAECEWAILLGTGGPADRVLVTTTFDGDIERVEYQYRDWFQGWFAPRSQDLEVVESFAHLFYFGVVKVTVDEVEC